jgi:citrate lyase subunit gamma (acyl carrier protein)
MDIKITAAAGTLESSDINIIIEPSDSNGISIDLRSPVEKQFGKQIKKVITETLMELGIDKANVSAIDKGALDCVIKARVQAAVYRAAESKEYKW